MDDNEYAIKWMPPQIKREQLSDLKTERRTMKRIILNVTLEQDRVESEIEELEMEANNE